MSSKETLTIKNYIGLTGDKPIRFIASDVDGTLVNDAKAIPEDAIEAIRAARESGIRVAIASGRAWNEMNDVIESIYKFILSWNLLQNIVDILGRNRVFMSCVFEW